MPIQRSIACYHHHYHSHHQERPINSVCHLDTNTRSGDLALQTCSQSMLMLQISMKKSCGHKLFCTARKPYMPQISVQLCLTCTGAEPPQLKLTAASCMGLPQLFTTCEARLTLIKGVRYPALRQSYIDQKTDARRIKIAACHRCPSRSLKQSSTR